MQFSWAYERIPKYPLNYFEIICFDVFQKFTFPLVAYSMCYFFSVRIKLLIDLSFNLVRKETCRDFLKIPSACSKKLGNKFRYVFYVSWLTTLLQESHGQIHGITN